MIVFKKLTLTNHLQRNNNADPLARIIYLIFKHSYSLSFLPSHMFIFSFLWPFTPSLLPYLILHFLSLPQFPRFEVQFLFDVVPQASLSFRSHYSTSCSYCLLYKILFIPTAPLSPFPYFTSTFPLFPTPPHAPYAETETKVYSNHREHSFTPPPTPSAETLATPFNHPWQDITFFSITRYVYTFRHMLCYCLNISNVHDNHNPPPPKHTHLSAIWTPTQPQLLPVRITFQFSTILRVNWWHSLLFSSRNVRMWWTKFLTWKILHLTLSIYIT